MPVRREFQQSKREETKAWMTDSAAGTGEAGSDFGECCGDGEVLMVELTWRPNERVGSRMRPRMRRLRLSFHHSSVFEF